MEDKYLYAPYPLNRIMEYKSFISEDYDGFKLMHLDLLDHPFLGTVQIEFVDASEINEGPYCSVIIGPNGSGKSYLQRTIVDIFRQLFIFEKRIKDKPNYVIGGFNMIFFNHGAFYTFGNIEYSEIKNGMAKRSRKKLNLENAYQAFLVKDGADVSTDKVLPNKILASAFTIWDKFLYQPNIDTNAKEKTFEKSYEYLGIKYSDRAAGTKQLIRNTVDNIVSGINGKKMVPNLKELLLLLGYDEKLKISYLPKYRNQFWNKNLDYKSFCNLFDDWTSTFKERETEPWGLAYYNKIKTNKDLIKEICRVLNHADLREYGKQKRGRYLEYEVLNTTTISADFPVIGHVDKLDLLSAPDVKFSKNGELISLDTSSSGESQIITSLISIIAKLQSNSLVLIDEPETSLHPNWQMQYMEILRKMFAHFSTSHFIIATHSHFMVSDSVNEKSKIIGVNRRGTPNSIRKSSMVVVDTPDNSFGWSAEEVLYSVFGVRSSRNHYLEYDLTKLITLINRDSKDKSEIERILEKITPLKLSDADPLKIIIEKAENYLAKLK
ncbi:MAG: putative ATP-binding protein involved in virulence [Glaciecola sp.]|jgi:predicted ATP-binding protein involved in virulence